MPIALRIVGYLRKYPGFAFGTLSAALLSTILGLIYPRLTGYLIDDVIAKGQSDRLGWLIGVLVAVFLGRDGLNALRIMLNNIFEQKVILDLRQDLYAAFQKMPISWYDHRSSGDLLTRVSEDVMNMERMLIDGIEQGLVALLQLVGVGIILFRLDARLAAWSLAPIPFLAAGALLHHHGTSPVPGSAQGLLGLELPAHGSPPGNPADQNVRLASGGGGSFRHRSEKRA